MWDPEVEVHSTWSKGKVMAWRIDLWFSGPSLSTQASFPAFIETILRKVPDCQEAILERGLLWDSSASCLAVPPLWHSSTNKQQLKPILLTSSREYDDDSVFHQMLEHHIPIGVVTAFLCFWEFKSYLPVFPLCPRSSCFPESLALDLPLFPK